jgi:hypothetical protein
VIQYIFQEDMESRAYLDAMLAPAISRLEIRRRTNTLPSRPVELPGLRLADTTTAPATTTIIASHCRRPTASPSRGTAIIATKTGKVEYTGITRDTSSILKVKSRIPREKVRRTPESTAMRSVWPSRPDGSGNRDEATMLTTRMVTLAGSRKADRLGIRLEMRWLSIIFTSPIMAVLNKAILAQSTAKASPSLFPQPEFTLLPLGDATMVRLDGGGRK